jgi:hypothetical protein
LFNHSVNQIVTLGGCSGAYKGIIRYLVPGKPYIISKIKKLEPYEFVPCNSCGKDIHYVVDLLGVSFNDEDPNWPEPLGFNPHFLVPYKPSPEELGVYEIEELIKLIGEEPVPKRGVLYPLPTHYHKIILPQEE